MKKLLKSLLALTMVLAIGACSSSSSDDEGEAVTLTVGISPDYAPYESLDTDGNIIGFDVDMVKLFEGYLTEEYGVDYTLEFKQMDFDNIITQLQGDQIDLGISGFTYAEDRMVEWSEPYLGSSQVAVVAEGSDISSLDDLVGKTLAAQTGATGIEAAESIEDADVVSLANVENIFNGLASNQYDAAIVDIGVAKNYVNNADFVLIDGVIMDEKNYVIAKEGNTEVIDLMNECIEKFLASDDYTELCDQYELTALTE